MLRATLLLSALIALLAPSVASAAKPGAKAKFTATFEAKREITWNQPRGVNLKDCKGDHYYEAHGSETWEMKTAKAQRVLVMSGGRDISLWTFGTWDMLKPSGDLGLEVRGLRKRDLSISAGTTGGWCNPLYSPEPEPPNDCGTRLPTHVVRISNLAGTLLWSHVDAPWMRREKLGFDDCVLVTPDDVSSGDFPQIPAKLKTADLFNRRKAKIVLKGSKTFGPTGSMVPNFGVERTASATVSWKLTLIRHK